MRKLMVAGVLLAFSGSASTAQPAKNTTVVPVPAVTLQSGIVSGPWRGSANGQRASLSIGNQRGLHLDGGCNKLLGKGYLFTLRGYRGKNLMRIDDRSEMTYWQTSDSRGNPTVFKVQMHYYAPEKAWVTSKALPPSFGRGLATTRVLFIRNSKQQLVAQFSGAGSSKAVANVRGICGS